jgi:hypothetical protein
MVRIQLVSNKRLREVKKRVLGKTKLKVITTLSFGGQTERNSGNKHQVSEQSVHVVQINSVN